MPPGNPLAPLDASGNSVREGDSVLIPAIPDWLTHDLPPEEVAALQALAGTVMAILEVDAYGYLWFGVGTPWFSLRPTDVLLQPSGGSLI